MRILKHSNSTYSQHLAQSQSHLPSVIFLGHHLSCAYYKGRVCQSIYSYFEPCNKVKYTQLNMH